MDEQNIGTLEQIEERIKRLSVGEQLELLNIIVKQLQQRIKVPSGYIQPELPFATVLADEQKKIVPIIRLGCACDWWNDPAEDIYTLEDGEPFNPDD